jgi:hypothetical protein
MATKREQFQALRLTGMDATKAQEQVYGIKPAGLTASVTPAVANIGGTSPVAPVVAPIAPAPTISPTSPITKQDYSFMGADNSPMQADIAPAVPPSSVATPQAPIVAPVVPQVPPTETLWEKNRRQQAEFAEKTQTGVNTPDFNTSQGREQDILKNLNEGFTNAPSLFQNQEAYKKAYGYDTADQGKKAILDSFFAGKQTPTDSNSLYSQLSSGVAISDPRIIGTQEYKTAKTRFDTLNKYKSYTQEQIGTALNTGDLLPWTREYNDAILDPNLKAKIDGAKQLNTIKGANFDANKVGETLSKKVVTGTLAKALEDGDLSADELQSLSQTDEVRESAKQVNDLAIKRNEMKAQFDKIENDVTEKLKGTGATSTDKAQMIANARKLILPEYNLAIDNYNTAFGTYTELKKDALNLFAQNMDLYKERKASEAQNARDERNFAQQKEMMSLQQAYQNPDINSTNPQIAQIATQKLIDESLKFAQTNGVPVTRNSGAILADAKAYAQKNGVSLAQAIQTTFTDPLTQKPEYREALANIRSKNEPAGKIQVIGERIDPTTGTKVNVYGQVDKSGNIVEYNTGSQATDSIENFTTTRRGSTSVQCGELVNDYWKSVTGSGAGIGDTLQSKLATLDKIGKSDTPVVGGIFVSNPLGNTVGHTGIIQQVNSDGSIVVREANAKGSINGQPPVSKTYTAQQAQNMAFSMPPAKPQSQATAKIAEDAKTWINLWNTGAMDLETIMTKIGSAKETLPIKTALTSYVNEQWGVAWRKQDDPAVRKLQSYKEIADWLLNNTEQLENVSGWVQFSPWDSLTQEKQTYLAKVQNLLENKTLQGLIDAKSQGATFGALSNVELQMLQSSSSVLAGAAVRDKDSKITGFNLTESELKKELWNISKMYDTNITRMTGGDKSFQFDLDEARKIYNK